MNLVDIFKRMSIMLDRKAGEIPRDKRMQIMINNCFFNIRKTGNVVNQSVPKRFFGVVSATDFKNQLSRHLGKDKYKFNALLSPSLPFDADKIREFLADPERNLTRKTAKGQIVKDWHSIAFSIFLELDEVISVAELKALSKAS